MDLLSREKTGKVERPVRVLQFGEGNFLRAFVDYWFDLANEKAGWNGKCCLVTGRRRDQLPVCDGQGFTGVV